MSIVFFEKFRGNKNICRKEKSFFGVLVNESEDKAGRRDKRNGDKGEKRIQNKKSRVEK